MAKKEIVVRSAEDVIEQARADLITEHIFFGYLCMKLEIVEDITCPTAWTDGVRIGYNPKFISTLTRSQAKTLFAHETAHCFLGHQFRRGTREHGLWNSAADHAVNVMLSEARFAALGDWLCDKKYSGWEAERIYADMYEERKKKEEEEQQKEQEKPEGNDGNPEPEEQEDNSQPEEDEPEEEQPEDPPESGDESDEEGEPDESTDSVEPDDSGSGDGEEEGEGEADGEPQPYDGPEPGTPDGPSMTGEVRDAPVADGEDAPMPESEWAMEAERAAGFAKSAGKFGAYLDGVVTRLAEPDMPWREILHKWIQMSSNADYSYGKIDRRFVPHSIVMPSLKSEQYGKFVFVTDVSGSVSDAEFRACATEVVSAIEECEPEEVHVIQFDAPINSDPLSAIRDYQMLEKGDDIAEVKRMGFGGTAFRPVFQFIEANEIEPDAMIFLTDMCPCDEWPEEPEYPVLWISTRAGYEAPWGETIYLLDGGDVR